jgi:circadian clock protein KaiB
MIRAEEGRLVLRLYIAGHSPNSVTALINLNQLRQEQLKDATIDIVDVLLEPERAMADRVITAPALFKVSPQPSRVLLGNLSDRSKVLRGLGLATPTEP